MNIKFYKYQGAGNDFIMIDDRSLNFPKDNIQLVSHMCNRHFGIGSDGLILLQNDTLSDFRMVYYNLDGNESTMCGNGGRCIVAFARDLGIIDKIATFNAIDGGHIAEINHDIIKLKMIDVKEYKVSDQYSFFQTGSPHHVQPVNNLKNYDVYNEGKKIRYADMYNSTGGTNVNFVEPISKNEIFVRTYERGVEDETLACGTGVTAAALDFAEKNNIRMGELKVKVLGGELKVYWFKKHDYYQDVWLEGPAKNVFKGELDLDL